VASALRPANFPASRDGRDRRKAKGSEAPMPMRAPLEAHLGLSRLESAFAQRSQGHHFAVELASDEAALLAL
jgi:hypothetical protein